MIVGAGRAGSRHAQAALRVPEVELVGFYDTDRGRAESLALAFGGSVFSELPSAPVASLAVICTPPATHANLARMALAAGCHVLVEKPFSLDTASIEEIDHIACRVGLFVGAVAQHRFSADARLLRTLVQASSLGQVNRVEVAVQRFRSSDYFADRSADWRQSRSGGGGVLISVGFHYLDLACWIVGPPSDARAILHERINGVDSFISGTFGLGTSAATVTARWGEVAVRPDTLRILCAQGNLELTGDKLREGGSGEHVSRAELHARQLRDLVAAIREGRRPFVTPSDVKAALVTIFAMYESAGCLERERPC